MRRQPLDARDRQPRHVRCTRGDAGQHGDFEGVELGRKRQDARAPPQPRQCHPVTRALTLEPHAVGAQTAELRGEAVQQIAVLRPVSRQSADRQEDRLGVLLVDVLRMRRSSEPALRAVSALGLAASRAARDDPLLSHGLVGAQAGEAAQETGYHRVGTVDAQRLVSTRRPDLDYLVPVGRDDGVLVDRRQDRSGQVGRYELLKTSVGALGRCDEQLNCLLGGDQFQHHHDSAAQAQGRERPAQRPH